MFADSPGSAPGQGTGSDTLSKQIVSNQIQLNLRAGDYEAFINSTLWDETTGVIKKVPRGVRVTLPDGYDIIDPAYMEFITYDLPQSFSKRGIAFTSSDRWVLDSVSVRYDPETGTKEVSHIVNHETHGVPGETYRPPADRDWETRSRV